MTRHRLVICVTAVIAFSVALSTSAPLHAADEDPAVAAFVRGKTAFTRQDYRQAQTEFAASYKVRRAPLTAYFLSVAFFSSSAPDYASAERWATTALQPVQGYTLDPKYVNGAHDIISFSRARLAPPAPQQQSSDGIGLSASAITSRPRPPVPSEVPEGKPIDVAARVGPAARGDIKARAGVRGLAASPPGTIVVGSATYGGNCGVATGNVTAHIARGCNGSASCTYTVDYMVIGDPAPGCVKDYSVSYGCAGSNVRRTASITGEEAGFRKTVTLSCS